MLIIQTHKFFSDDHNVEIQNKEIWQNGSLVYSCKNGLENDDASQVSPFEGEQPIQTLYETNKGTIQHNHEDDSFYFRLADDVTMASYVDSELKIEDPNGQFNDHVTFANSLMAK